MSSLARMVLASCTTICPATGALGTSLVEGAVGVGRCCCGMVVCDIAAVAPSRSVKTATLAPVLSMMVYLQKLGLAGRAGDLRLRCKKPGRLKGCPPADPRIRT